MAEITVHELASELGIAISDLMGKLRDLELEVTGPESTISHWRSDCRSNPSATSYVRSIPLSASSRRALTK